MSSFHSTAAHFLLLNELIYIYRNDINAWVNDYDDDVALQLADWRSSTLNYTDTFRLYSLARIHESADFNIIPVTSSLNMYSYHRWMGIRVRKRIRLRKRIRVFQSCELVQELPNARPSVDVFSRTGPRTDIKGTYNSAECYKLDKPAWISFFHLLMHFVDHSRCPLNASAHFVHYDECWGFAALSERII